MKMPNWQHHSKKEQKRRLKPQALRQAKARKQALKRALHYKEIGSRQSPFAVCRVGTDVPVTVEELSTKRTRGAWMW